MEPARDDPDTALARRLHAEGVVPLPALQAALAAARAQGGGLAAALAARGLAFAAPAVGPPPAPPGAAAQAWVAGAEVAGHVLVRELGRGGMGVVWEAEHRATGARRALKALTGAADATALARFQREAEALAAVDDHPAIGRVHAFGVVGGRPWLALDLLPGGSLLDRLRRGPLAPDEAADLGVALARGLAHAHARGVLHRDVKPANVLFDDAGRPRLVDFGLARVEGQAGLTATGELLGTPAYMAPEQALGDGGALDARTDVYGLGALLFHALAGASPFDGASLFAVLEQVARVGAPPLRSARPEVPPGLAAAVDRALSRDPAARFPGAGELALALEAWRAGARRAGRGRAGPRLVLATAGLALACGGALAATWTGRLAPSSPGSAAPARGAPRPEEPAGSAAPDGGAAGTTPPGEAAPGPGPPPGRPGVEAGPAAEPPLAVLLAPWLEGPLPPPSRGAAPDEVQAFAALELSPKHMLFAATTEAGRQAPDRARWATLLVRAGLHASPWPDAQEALAIALLAGEPPLPRAPRAALELLEAAGRTPEDGEDGGVRGSAAAHAVALRAEGAAGAPDRDGATALAEDAVSRAGDRDPTARDLVLAALAVVELHAGRPEAAARVAARGGDAKLGGHLLERLRRGDRADLLAKLEGEEREGRAASRDPDPDATLRARARAALVGTLARLLRAAPD